MVQIRLFQKQDAAQIAQLFHDTVRQINLRDYSSQQVQAWAPDDINFSDWLAVCSSRFTVVADDRGTIAGFGDLESDGHIDHFFCHRQYQRCGVGRQIYQAIEAKAIELGIRRLFTEASITAKPFFLAIGFSVLQEQEVFCRGETFVNYAMEKILPEPETIAFHPLGQDDAQQILNWRYAPPYDYYNADAACFEEELCSLLNPQNAYYAMLNSDGKLEGYCCFGADAQVPGGNYPVEALDIGMGIRPDLTGQGRGIQYAQKVIQFGAARYQAQQLRVTIATFNKRAQRVWKKLGFEPIEKFATVNREEFVIMLRHGESPQR